MDWDFYRNWRRYVPVAARRRQAARLVARMKKSGRTVAPVEIAGRRIATTFWGEAWCNNLEAYSDYANRLPRGRTYVRNGSVIDLRIKTGRVRALVSGSSIYEVEIAIAPLARRRWTAIKRQCAGRIDSLVELLRGTLSKGVMEIVTRKSEGLFPSPREITLACSCPDWAAMCKHVAATLYGSGARLDRRPELLFTLRGVDPAEMVDAAVDRPIAAGVARQGRMPASAELSSVFGVDIDTGETDSGEERSPAKRKRRKARSTGRPASRTRRRKKTARSGTVKATGGAAAKKPAARKVAAKRRSTAKARAGRAATRKTRRT